MNLDVLNHLTPDQLRGVLPRVVSAYIADPEVSQRNRSRIEALTAQWTESECVAVLQHLLSIGADHQLYAANPSCRELSRVWCEDVFLAAHVHGMEHLVAAASNGPTIVVSNHLSYIDSTAIDAAVSRAGHAFLADRLVSIAGPKVYSDLFRRIASSSLSTLPVPQSTSLSHTEQLSVRELARKARIALDAGIAALEEGSILLLYPEGSRTRTGRLQPFLKGAHRYLGLDGLTVVPMGLVGTDKVMPVGETLLHPGQIQLTFGPGVQRAGSTRDLLAHVHALVGGLLPDGQVPLEGDPVLH